MRSLYALLFSIIFSNPLFSQETITISGQILDAESKEPLAFANVAVHELDTNALVTGAISDEQGRFTIDGVALGEYALYFSFIGFATLEQMEVAGGLNKVFDLGEVELLH